MQQSVILLFCIKRQLHADNSCRSAFITFIVFINELLRIKRAPFVQFFTLALELPNIHSS